MTGTLTTGEYLVRVRMEEAGIHESATEAFLAAHRTLVSGATGLIPEATIDPLVEVPSLADLPEPAGPDGLARTAVLKLNGGLGTSMGLDRAKSLLRAREQLTFLDLIARQVLAARDQHGVTLPVTFLHSFRTSVDSRAALAAYPALATDGLPLELMQNRVPKLRADDLTPVSWPQEPGLEWCPPGHGDLYTVLHSSGLLDDLLDRGFTQLFVSNSDNLAAVPDLRIAAWFAGSGCPFAVEAVRRTPSDRKGGHFARRRADGRIVLRETAQTSPEDMPALADLGRHRLASTNNIWIDIRALRDLLRERNGVLGLPLIKNSKTVDPADSASTPVIQVETAMGAAIELFEGAAVLEVGRDRFLPVKTTDDLLVLRSDCVDLDAFHRPVQRPGGLPFVSLGSAYKTIEDFEQRFPAGVPSLVEANSLVVDGDWTFGRDVRIRGDVRLADGHGRVPNSTTLQGAAR
jgi:UTP--glucose-1-phosphate uridylyltransferase